MTLFKNAIRCAAGHAAVTSMSGAEEAKIGPPLEYGGSADTLNPEELFVAAINSCLMLVFQHIAASSGVMIESYEASAEGIVEKTRDGLRFTGVSVLAQVKAGAAATAAKLGELAELKKFCLVSNSVSCPVSYSVTPA